MVCSAHSPGLACALGEGPVVAWQRSPFSPAQSPLRRPVTLILLLPIHYCYRYINATAILLHLHCIALPPLYRPTTLLQCSAAPQVQREMLRKFMLFLMTASMAAWSTRSMDSSFRSANRHPQYRCFQMDMNSACVLSTPTCLRLSSSSFLSDYPRVRRTLAHGSGIPACSPPLSPRCRVCPDRRAAASRPPGWPSSPIARWSGP